jgi:hypothetical protein
MDFKNIFIGLGVMLIGIIGVFGILNSWNSYYSMDVGSTFNDTLSGVQDITDNTMDEIKISSGLSTQTAEGAGQDTPTEEIAKQSVSTIKLMPKLIGLVPSLLNDIGSIIGIPVEIVAIGVSLFIIVFALTFAYLLLLGVRRLL